MVVYEIKDAKSTSAVSNVRPRRRKVNPVEPSEGIQPVDFFSLSGDWSGERRQEWKDRRGHDQGDIEKNTSSLMRMINDQMASLNILIHLTIFKDETGYFLEVHDCADGKSCRKVAEIPVDINDLPELLKKLRHQAGILVDKRM